jgi:ubiquinone/menaquinone biosynthesis C-methylase UbiE
MNAKLFVDRFSEEYESRGKHKYLFYRRLVDAVIRQIDRNKGKFLDLGTGNGELAVRVAMRFPRSKVTGLDMSEEMIGKAKRKARRIGLKNIDFVPSSMEKMKLENIDTVMSSFVFHHIKDKQKVISAVHKRLPKNGKLIIGDWFRPSKEYVSDVEKIRSRYPNSANEFDKSWTEFLGSMSEEYRERHTKEYLICPTELKEIMKKAGFKRQNIVKLPIADFAVVVGVK